MKSHFQGTFTIIFDNLSAIPVLRDSYQCGYAAKTLETLRNKLYMNILNLHWSNVPDK